MAKKTTDSVEVSCNSEEIKELLKKKLPSCFEREPAPAYTGNLDKLVEEIVALCK